MSNTENQFLQGFTYEQFMAAHGDKLQKKRDKTGGAVEGAAYNKRVGAEWGDLIDDLMIAFAQDLLPEGVEFFDNRATPTTITPIGDGGDTDEGSFSIGKNFIEVMFFILKHRSGETQANKDFEIEFFADSGRTVPIFQRTYTDIDGDLIETVGAHGMGPAGAPLESNTLYWRIRNNSTFITKNFSFALFGRIFDIADVSVPDPPVTPV